MADPDALGHLPDFVREALESRGLIEAFLMRPQSQQDHYVRRILRAIRGATIQKRLDQMLDELEGDLYMKQPFCSPDVPLCNGRVADSQHHSIPLP